MEMTPRISDWDFVRNSISRWVQGLVPYVQSRSDEFVREQMDIVEGQTRKDGCITSRKIYVEIEDFRFG